MAKISLKNIQKVYSGNVKVIEDLNLEIQDKEFIVLALSFRLRKVNHAANDRRPGRGFGWRIVDR